MNVVPKFTKTCRSRCSRQSCADDNDGVLPFVGRVDEFHGETVGIPLFLYRTSRNLRVKLHLMLAPIAMIKGRAKRDEHFNYLNQRKYAGMTANTSGMTSQKITATESISHL